ncbi:hypothetical protein HPB50_009000 [Hyalomma asiaticum]|uniref:Uncharacterized protein n=1 Tax=Hyalomma asiaticum TaxID=266040 RepID=A0ACB7SA97_HYAAI|nr:hypothetical protein HPB50_009000 [Hyalomma asiaticum]
MELVRRSKNFSVAESDALITLWSDPETQKKFDSAYRHSVIWEMIANKLRMHGYERSSIDCKTKINNLKATYFKFRRIYSAGGVGVNAAPPASLAAVRSRKSSGFPTSPPRFLPSCPCGLEFARRVYALWLCRRRNVGHFRYMPILFVGVFNADGVHILDIRHAPVEI